MGVENIPLYEDDISPFGSTTSDTIRTSVTSETTKLLVFVVCFGDSHIEEHKQKAIELFSKYCNATNITLIEVEKE